MKIKQAKFLKSSQKMSQCPEADLPEFGFIGRSNVGKSSLINMLTGRNSLAKTSATPGKTRLINHFIIDDAWLIADLPGYGYAKVSKKERGRFGKLINDYIRHRESLICMFVLIDSRISPQAIDLEFIQWLGENEIPFIIIFTKSDKSNQKDLNRNISQFKDALKEQWEELPGMILTSSHTQKGREEVLDFISSYL